MTRVYRLLKQIQPDFIEAIDPPALIPAAWFKSKTSIPLLYFSMELFTETPALVQRRFKKWIWGFAEKQAVSRASQVATVSQSIALILNKKFNRSSAVWLVRNAPETRPALIKNEDPQYLRQKTKAKPTDLVLVYQGVIEPGRGIFEVAAALANVDDMRFAVIGYGPLEEKLKALCQNQNNVFYLGPVAREALPEVCRGADAGLVWIEALSESYRLSLPGKLFDYIHWGLPVWVNDLPEVAALVRKWQIGVVSPRQGLSNGIQELKNLVQDPQIKLRLSEAAQVFCWESEGLNLQQAVQACLQKAQE
jgi:glycosyltransferase involved in cell wall biosynthesis